MSYHGKQSDRDCPFDAERGAPVGLRIQRTISPERAPDCPPPAVPEFSHASSSSSEDEKDMESESEVRVAVEKKTHIPLQKRTSYVEEPPSVATTLDRQELKKEKERALVRRITNEMQMAHFIQKVEIPKYAAVNTAKSPPFIQPSPTAVNEWDAVVTSRDSLENYYGVLEKEWPTTEGFQRCNILYLADLAQSTVSSHLQFIAFTFFFCISLLGPFFYHNNISIGSPFPFIFGNDYAKDRNVGLRPATHFNYSNPQFKTLDFVNENSFSVLMRTRFPKDTILRRDAVLAYSTLKKKLEDFPAGHKELLEMCPFDCENEKEMVDKIIRKSSQVALTYPETFVSMTKDDRNISRAYLGGTIGGVEVDTDDAIDRAQALLMTFALREDITPAQKKAWIENFNDQIDHTGASNVSFFRWSPVSFTNDMVQSMSSVTSILPASAIIVVFICLLATLGPNAYQTKPSVGLITALVLVLSCLGGGSVSLLFVKSVDPIVWPVFFIIAAIGSLFSLQLHQSWSRFSFAATHPTEKIAFIFAHDGPGIIASAGVIVLTFGFMALITSVTSSNIHMQATFVALAAGVFISVVLCFLFIAIFIYKEGRRECKGVKWYQFFKTGDTHFTAPSIANLDDDSLFHLHDRLIDNRPSFLRTFAFNLVSKRSGYFSLALALLIIMGAVIGCYQMKIEIREEHFVPSDSSASVFIDNYRNMFGKTNQFIELIFDSHIDYNDDHVSAAIQQMLESTVAEGYASRSISWLTEFAKFEQNSVYDINSETFVPVVNLVFLTTDPYKRFASDVIFDRYQNEILRSRMYLELTEKGLSKRADLVSFLRERARSAHLPMSIEAPFTVSLDHDIKITSLVLLALGAGILCMFTLGLVLFGQPTLVFLLVLTSALVVLETTGYSALWNVPMNIVTFTMVLSGNALTSVIVMAFCYSYSVSGKNEMRITARIQYSFQATLLPVLIACSLPVLSYLPFLFIDSPIIIHICKVIVVNSLCSLIHYLLFLPNLMVLIAEYLPVSCRNFDCREFFCDGEEDDSIYYIPTTGRAIHPSEGIYQHVSYTYSVPKPIHSLPPSYLAISAPPSNTTPTPYTVDYGMTEATGRRTRRHRRNSESSTNVSQPNTPKMGRAPQRERRRSSNRDDSIYEAPPSPRSTSSPRSVYSNRKEMRRDPPQPAQTNYDSAHREFESHRERSANQWRPSSQTQQNVFYPQSRR